MTALLSSLSFFLPAVVWMFVFAIIYGFLEKFHFLGQNKGLHGLVAVSVAFLIILIPETRDLINFMTPWFVIFLILAVFIILFLMLFGIKQEEITGYFKDYSAGTTTVIAIVAAIFIFAMYKVFGPIFNYPEAGAAGLWANLMRIFLNPKVLGVIILLLIIAAIIKYIGYESPVKG